MFCPQVRSGDRGGCKKKLGVGIDRGTIFLLGPRKQGIVGAQPGLDMSDGNSGRACGKRSAKRARSVTLNDHQLGAVSKRRQQRRRHRSDMFMGVFAARAAEAHRAKAAKTKRACLEPRMLPSQAQCRRQSSRGERLGEGCQFDRFRPGTDDQPDVPETQSSP